jgi:sterol desaturase/sphingolipid hydroxylase (fatty acid hydroxylase superfamily)
MIRLATAHLAYPTLLFGSVTLVGLLLSTDLAPALVVGSVLVAVAVALLACERLLPATPRAALPEVVRMDALHTLSSFLTSAGIAAGVTSVGIAAGVAGAGWLSETLGARMWPTHWPLAVQLVASLVLGELGAYAAHRLCHASPGWWRIHAMHHSAEHLYLLAAGRNHPLNVLWTYALQTFPLVLLGANPELLALHGAFTGAQGLAQHCNARFETRVWEWFLATPRLHRIHHGHEAADGDSNLGNNLIVWDLVFGTRRLDPEPAAFGLGPAFPATFLGQLASPWTLE